MTVQQSSIFEDIYVYYDPETIISCK